MVPFISVIIPTYNRPYWLLRAIDSALADMPSNEIEIIVVPNGPDESWRELLVPYQDNRSIRILPIGTAHANIARNHGLANARGKYVRFLDDDDYLISHAAKAQYEYIEQAGADICSGLIRNVDADGEEIGILSFPKTKDFVCAALSITGFTLPTGNIFNKACIGNIKWDEMAPYAQDNIWMHDLAMARDWNWIHYEHVVGVWRQHQGERVSSNKKVTEKPMHIINSIMGLYQDLTINNRINSERKIAIAQALWYYIYRGFPYRPLYWTDIAYRARNISPLARPPQPIFENLILKNIDPILSQWLLFPLRKASILYKDIKSYFFGFDYRRTL